MAARLRVEIDVNFISSIQSFCLIHFDDCRMKLPRNSYSHRRGWNPGFLQHFLVDSIFISSCAISEWASFAHFIYPQPTPSTHTNNKKAISPHLFVLSHWWIQHWLRRAFELNSLKRISGISHSYGWIIKHKNDHDERNWLKMEEWRMDELKFPPKSTQKNC